ncbi:murein hydrolase activator EnvC family protein [Enterococcus eurekensis]|uniref:Murein hydrolase activator EnvC family protein n=1 Tax=Enterococcus eurekensis TaxID=1159753 RepID=A0ABV9M290_9ENTE
MLNIKKLTILALSSALLIGPVLTVQADEYDTKIQEQTEKITNLESEQQVAQNTLTALENQITRIETEIAETAAKKVKEEERLNEINLEIADLKVAIEKRNKQLEEQARNVQVNQSSSSIIEAVLTADSLNEALGRAMAVTTIVNANNEIIEKQKEDQEQLEKLLEEAKQRLTTIEVQAKVLAEKEESLTATRLDQQVAINELQAMIATEKKQKQKFEKQKEEAIKRREAELKAIAEEKARASAAQQAYEKEEAARAAAQAQAKASYDNSNATVEEQPQQPATPTPPASSGWGMPVSNVSVSSRFSWRTDPFGSGASELHNGIDMVGSSGTPIFASKAGTVVQASYDPSAGNHVIIDHGDGYYTYYMHLSSFAVSAGQSVGQGTTVGGMGTTGSSTGVHLHFAIATGIWSGFMDPGPLLGI